MAKTPYVDPWTTDQSNWEYVTIPMENALGERHASVSNNKHVFEPGKSYLVPSIVAADVRERLHVYARACVRTLQPRRDYQAENAVSIGTASGANYTPVDASKIPTVG